MTDTISPLEEKTLIEEKTEQAAAKHLDCLQLLGDMPVTLSVCVGSTEISVSALKALKKGQVLPLDSTLEQEVCLKLNDSIIGWGQLVVSNNNYAIKINELSK